MYSLLANFYQWEQQKLIDLWTRKTPETKVYQISINSFVLIVMTSCIKKKF